MSKYLPDTIDLKAIKEKFKSELEYNNLQIRYRNYIEELLNSLIDFDSINNMIDNFNLNLKEIGDETYNIYHKKSKLKSSYLFIRNNIHIENLNDDEIKALKDNKLYESFVTDTIDRVLDEPKDFLSYTSNNKDLKYTKGLIIEFAYDSNGLTEEEKKKVKDLANDIFDVVKESLQHSKFITNNLIYDKDPDDFRPKVKNRSSLLDKMKIVKEITNYEIEDDEAFKESLPTIEYKDNSNLSEKSKQILKGVSDAIDEQVLNEDEDTEEEFSKNDISNNKYNGIVEGKSYTVRLIGVSKAKRFGKELYLYDYSLNNNHSIYYSDININDLVNAHQQEKIDILFSLENLKIARRYMTSYIGTIVDNQVVYEQDVDNILYDSKVVTRENGNLVIINIGSTILNNKRMNSYYILNLATNDISLVNTETDVFSNINTNEELAKWLDDDIVSFAKYTDGYIGYLRSDGSITYDEL